MGGDLTESLLAPDNTMLSNLFMMKPSSLPFHGLLGRIGSSPSTLALVPMNSRYMTKPPLQDHCNAYADSAKPQGTGTQIEETFLVQGHTKVKKSMTPLFISSATLKDSLTGLSLCLGLGAMTRLTWDAGSAMR